MSQQFVTWLEAFLGNRELNHPDGRALYAYRCSHEEFDSSNSQGLASFERAIVTKPSAADFSSSS